MIHPFLQFTGPGFEGALCRGLHMRSIRCVHMRSIRRSTDICRKHSGPDTGEAQAYAGNTSVRSPALRRLSGTGSENSRTLPYALRAGHKVRSDSSSPLPLCSRPLMLPSYCSPAYACASPGRVSARVAGPFLPAIAGIRRRPVKKSGFTALKA